MIIFVDENPNCRPCHHAFPIMGREVGVQAVRLQTPWGDVAWCDVTSVEGKMKFRPAKAILMDDSNQGTAWLCYGGHWGLRFKRQGDEEKWSMDNLKQWGLPYLVMETNSVNMEFR